MLYNNELQEMRNHKDAEEGALYNFYKLNSFLIYRLTCNVNIISSEQILQQSHPIPHNEETEK